MILMHLFHPSLNSQNSFILNYFIKTYDFCFMMWLV